MPEQNFKHLSNKFMREIKKHADIIDNSYMPKDLKIKNFHTLINQLNDLYNQ